jgi:hypothetical protein
LLRRPPLASQSPPVGNVIEAEFEQAKGRLLGNQGAAD